MLPLLRYGFDIIYHAIVIQYSYISVEINLAQIACKKVAQPATRDAALMCFCSQNYLQCPYCVY